MTTSFQGYAFVTGAASGIGRAVCTAFAQSGVLGICLTDINEEGLYDVVSECSKVATNALFQTLVRRVDARDQDEISAALLDTKEKFGRIDYVVNSFGIMDQGGTLFADMPIDNFDAVNTVNSRALFQSMKAEIKLLRTQELKESKLGRSPLRGSIVNIVSAASVVVVPGSSSYTTSKHAAAGLTKAAAVDHAGDGIRINAVSPSYIETPLMDPFLAVAGVRQKFESLAPLGRLGQPAEVADVVLFFSSCQSSFITGQNLIVDGGLTLL